MARSSAPPRGTDRRARSRPTHGHPVAGPADGRCHRSAMRRQNLHRRTKEFEIENNPSQQTGRMKPPETTCRLPPCPFRARMPMTIPTVPRAGRSAISPHNSTRTYTVNQYRQTDLTVSGEAVRGGNVDTVTDTEISTWYCPDHSRPNRTITPCFLKEKQGKPELPERLGSSLNHSHSIINRSRKPAWLKGFAVIDMGLYRRFYRHKRTSFAGAGDGAICGATTLATQSSITSQGYRRQ